jgi:hypothetical protein
MDIRILKDLYSGLIRLVKNRYPYIWNMSIRIMETQKCVDYQFRETRVIRTALPFELLCSIIDEIKSYAIRKKDIRRLFYTKYGLLLDRIQIHSAFAYLMSKGYIKVRPQDMSEWVDGIDEEFVGNRCGHVVFMSNWPRKEDKIIKNRLRIEMSKETKSTNCLSFSYLLERSKP